MLRIGLLLTFVVCTGCAGWNGFVECDASSSPLPASIAADSSSRRAGEVGYPEGRSPASLPSRSARVQMVSSTKPTTASTGSGAPSYLQQASHITLATEPDMGASDVQPTAIEQDQFHSPFDNSFATVEAAAFAAPGVNVIELNLPTALSLVGGSQPVVGLAQWRVQQAYAKLDQASALWLPSIRAGFSFHRHDGNYQASDGSIVDVNRNSFQYGLGNGATGAGTTPQPGIVSQFHFAEAIYEPKVRRKTAWAAGHAAVATQNQQMLRVAVAYTQLLRAYQEVHILEQALDRTASLQGLTQNFAESGQGLQADADRLQTEAVMVESRLISARENVDVASADLAQALSIDATQTILPMDASVVPLEFVTEQYEAASLVGTGLATRPELKESQALVSAAVERLKQVKHMPLIPSVVLGYSNSGFGGGLGNDLADVRNRYDLDAQMVWEVRNMGFGEKARRREASAQIQQAKYENLRMMDNIANDITTAHAKVLHRAEQIQLMQNATTTATNSYQRNVDRIRDGAGLPLEALQSLQALEQVNLRLLNITADYNNAQFELQWALGWPVDAALN